MTRFLPPGYSVWIAFEEGVVCVGLERALGEFVVDTIPGRRPVPATPETVPVEPCVDPATWELGRRGWRQALEVVGDQGRARGGRVVLLGHFQGRGPGIKRANGRGPLRANGGRPLRHWPGRAEVCGRRSDGRFERARLFVKFLSLVERVLNPDGILPFLDP